MNRSTRKQNALNRRSASSANENNYNSSSGNPWGTNQPVPQEYLYMDSSEEENHLPTNPSFARTGHSNYNVPVMEVSAASASNSSAVPLPPPPSLMQAPSMMEVHTPVNLTEKFRRIALGEVPRGMTRIRNVATGERLPQPVNVQLVPKSKGGRRGRKTRRRAGKREGKLRKRFITV